MEEFIERTNKYLSKYGGSAGRVNINTIDICGRNIEFLGDLDKFKKDVLDTIRTVFKVRNEYRLVYNNTMNELYYLLSRISVNSNNPMWKFIQTDKQTYYGNTGEIEREVNITLTKNDFIGYEDKSEILELLLIYTPEITKYSVEFQYSISSIKVLEGEHPNVDPVTKKFHWSEFKKTPNVILSIDTFKRIEEEMAIADYSDYYKTQL
jgi:hypothetical protein